MSKKVIALIVIVILIILGIIGFLILKKSNEANPGMDSTYNITENPVESSEVTESETAEGITVVPTMNDKIPADSSWCGTFQLVWNDMKNKLVKKDVIFNPQLKMAENLNKEDFNETMISDDYYYKIYGKKTLELKSEIEKGIKEKFNQTSDILDDFDWSEDELDNEDVGRYFFYTMLYRKFEFLYEFDKLDNGDFGNKYNDIEYFGIDNKTKKEVGDQIDVLYYNSKDDFAVIINTKSDDEVIFCKKPKGKNFNDIYNNMIKESKQYKGSPHFEKVDEFKAPSLKIDEKREYTELEGKPFETVNGMMEIAKAIQTIKLSLDEKGGEIKSEAAIETKDMASRIPESEQVQPRYFYVDDTFTLFLREKGKDKPYFAGRVDDITKLQ